MHSEPLMAARRRSLESMAMAKTCLLVKLSRASEFGSLGSVTGGASSLVCGG